MFASRVHEFADESDNLLGGLLLTRGYRLYADYFSSHMPLPYYVAALPAWLGARQLDDFRVFTRLFLIVATLRVVWGFRKRISPLVLGIWAVVAVFATVLAVGQRNLADRHRREAAVALLLEIRHDCSRSRRRSSSILSGSSPASRR